MLKHHATRDVTKPDGTVWMMVSNDLVDDPCACGAESVPNTCNGDGRRHHHGMIHTKGGGLAAMCSECAANDRLDWGVRPWDR